MDGPPAGNEREPVADCDWRALGEADKRKTEAMFAAAAATAPHCCCDRPWLMASDSDGVRCMKCGLSPRAQAARAIVAAEAREDG